MGQNHETETGCNIFIKSQNECLKRKYKRANISLMSLPCVPHESVFSESDSKEYLV